MHIFSYLNRIVHKSITDNKIQLDDESFERLDNELSLIEEENIAYHFILNHRISSISRRLSIPLMPEYGAVGAWYVNYCLGVSLINPLYRGRRVQQFYRPSLENVFPLFIPVSEEHQEVLIAELKQEIDEDADLKSYTELNTTILSDAIVRISTKPLFSSMVLGKARGISGRLAKIKGQIIENEKQVGGFKFLKYDIFSASFIGEKLFETAMIYLRDNRLKHDKIIKTKLSPIMVHSFMDNLNLIVDSGTLLKMSTEDLYEYSLSTIAAMENAIKQFEKYGLV